MGQNIKLVERCLNSAESKTTRKTSFECLYGFNPTFVDSALKKVANVDIGRNAQHPPRERGK